MVHNVGADLRVCPGNGEPMCSPQSQPKNEQTLENIGQSHRIAPTSSPLHRVVQWFKTMTTNEYIRNAKTNNWQRFDGKLWQRNYWEHIIRNEKSHQNISEYILNNPIKWNADKLNPEMNLKNG